MVWRCCADLTGRGFVLQVWVWVSGWDGSTVSHLVAVLAATGVSGWVDGGWIYCIAVTGGVSGVSGGVSGNRCEWVGDWGDRSTVLLLLVGFAVQVGVAVMRVL